MGVWVVFRDAMRVKGERVVFGTYPPPLHVCNSSFARPTTKAHTNVDNNEPKYHNQPN